MKRVFRFRHYDEVPEGGSESKKRSKLEEKQTCLLPQERPTYYHDKSRAAPAHARSAFLRFRPMRKYQKEVSDQKSEEKQTCLLSQEKRSRDLRQCKLTLFILENFEFHEFILEVNLS